MVSLCKSSISIVLCIAAALMTASTTQAQLSAFPKRYRNSYTGSTPQVFGRKQRHRKHQQQHKKMHVRRNLSMNIEQSEGSMPLEEAAFSLSLEEVAFSMTLEDSFSMSMPDSEPSESVDLDNGGNSNGGKLILGSFLAGISVLVVGATALFVKMRKAHSKHASDEASESDRVHEAMQKRVASSYDDLM